MNRPTPSEIRLALEQTHYLWDDLDDLAKRNVTILRDAARHSIGMVDPFDRLRAAVEELEVSAVRPAAAKETSKTLDTIAKRLWKISKSLEDLHRLRIYDVGGIVRAVADLEGRTVGDVLTEIAEAEAFRFNDKLLVAYAQSRGVDPSEYLVAERWPELDETKGTTDEQDERSAR